MAEFEEIRKVCKNLNTELTLFFSAKNVRRKKQDYASLPVPSYK